MKIVFIQPNVGFKGHTWEALGIGYIIAYLKKYSRHKIEFDFFSGFYSSDETIINGCKDADIIGFSCTSPQYKHGLELARQIKTKHNWIVFGGIHPSALPKIALKEDCIDTVISGEGEQAMLEWTGKPLKCIQWAESITSLDSIPFPDRKAIKQSYNIEQAYANEGRTVASILSSRGCPFQCSFCCSRDLWGRKIRYRSPDNILDEMAYLSDAWGIQFIKFADDTFTASKRRILEFCQGKINRELKVKYGANAHVNTVDKHVIKALAKSGCDELWFGVESGSPRILKAMNKHTDIERVKLAFALCKEYGIKSRAYFLLGMPQETIEDIALTEKLCDEIQPDQVGFTLLAPFPSNEYFDYKTMSNWDWSKFDEYGNDWVHTETLSNKQLKDIQKRLVDKYQERATFRQRTNINDT